MLAIYKSRRRTVPAVSYPEGKGQREVCAPNVSGKKEYDRRRNELEKRQRNKCAICRYFNLNMEFDHQAGRGANGGHRDDRIVDEKGEWMNAALCTKCNQQKGSRRYRWIDGKYRQVLKEAVCKQPTPTLEPSSAISLAEISSTPPLRYRDFFKSQPAG
jgi:hypothetical protein